VNTLLAAEMYNVGLTLDFDQINLCNNSDELQVFHSAFVLVLEGCIKVKELEQEPSINAFASNLESLKV